MKDFEKFINGFRNFRRFYFDAENDYYASLNKGQHPKAIVIACSDSRADPALLMGCDPGDIFVVRNVANLVPHADDALRRDAVLAVLEYGVHHLKVEHIIVLGHSGCGGIQALLDPASLHDESFVANWVSLAAPALERMREDVRDESPADRQRHCEEAAILVSIDNLLSYPWIQERVAAHELSLHAWYFDMSRGALLAYFPDSETYRRAYGFAYDTEYPVAGCYGDYQDIFVGASGQDFCPYVFLLTTEGTVEYIDIFGGLWHGCLCSGGPLYGFRDIVSFESGVYEDGFGGGYETVYALDKNGRKYDMPACITAQGNAMPSYAAGKWCANVYHSVASGASYEGVYYLSIHENGLVEINDVIVSIDAPLQIAGYCTYLGTTELGMVYQFGLYSGDQLREGAFALDLYNTDYGEMTITPISGVNLFDAPGGGYTIFSRL